MGQITIRRTSADLPVFDQEADLEPVSSLSAGRGLVSGFEFGGASLRALDLENARLLSGKIRALRAGRASITGTRIDSVEFTGCELSSLRWVAGKISRVRFDSCKLLGARFEGVTLEHVVFTGCKLDYATLDQIRAAGPVLFVRCSLREAEFTGCNLASSLFDDCDLHLTGFGRGSYQGCDLRGNDLSALADTGHLKQVVIDRAQLLQLAEALAAELDVTFGDQEPDRP
ncbi:MAG: pentapeptide repeat-containing protein [Streptosporangiaceae bacterium]